MHASGSHGVEQFGFAILGWRDLYETRQPYSFSGFHRLEASAFLGIAGRNHPGVQPRGTDKCLERHLRGQRTPKIGGYWAAVCQLGFSPLL